VPEPPTLRRCVDRLVFVAPIRFGLGAVCLVLAWAAGAKGSVAFVAFAIGGFGVFLAVMSDRRAVFLGKPERVPVPDDARFAGRWEAALSACLPSTVGMTVLSLAALNFQPTLAALIAGGIAGLGLAGLVSGLRLAAQERDERIELYVAGGSRFVYERGLESPPAVTPTVG
jgi:hypothetical protein